MPTITLNKLLADPNNANTCSSEVLNKIQRNIERTGNCPALIVRPHPSQDGLYIIIDGHHRKQILESLGWQEVECQIWNISEPEARLALATLNRLRGEDIPRKRAELLDSLMATLPLEELVDLIPESNAEVKDLISLLDIDLESLERTVQKMQQEEIENIPVPFTFMIQAEKAPIVEKALGLFPQSINRSEALVAICEKITEESSNGEG